MAYLESAPSLREIAGRLSLIQRWNGRTTIPWSVLQHTLLANTLLGEDVSTFTRLIVLMHDAAEGWTGDIPRGFKCPEQAQMENDILCEIYVGLGLAPLNNISAFKQRLRYIDDVAALVEAQCLISPAERVAVVTRHYRVHPVDSELLRRGENELWSMRELSRADAVEEWVGLVQSCVTLHLEEA